MAGATTREQIIKAADQLFYSQGFEHTSFADIAAAVKLSRGNFYYHFKTKDDILDAVIDLRMANTRQMLDRWEEDGSTPADRIRCFIRILITNQTKIMAHGCPVGTLSSELAKHSHPALPDANRLFSLFRDWLAAQFTELGLADEADTLALHLLARSQGVATLANAFKDEVFVHHEVDQMNDWLSATLSTSAA